MSDKSELWWGDFISHRVLEITSQIKNGLVTPESYRELKQQFLKLSNPEKLDLLLLQIMSIRSELPTKEDTDD